ncbi:MAG TPA: tetraacyldisaccharide 4'-kinase [Patescibacteria group bacterium]|nr:tetraacyldisaccharide 4'-kinase [Patescibacteria group bacterium]
MMRTPPFWYDQTTEKHKWAARLLGPAGLVYGWVVEKRFDFYYPVPLAKPVICVGNITTGGAGKTPVVMSLVSMMAEAGYNPHILTRGYGGEEEGPLQVSPGRDTAADVGDEALLLVEKAPTWVATSRPLGAQAAIDTGATVIIMDDGFQNPGIHKDVAFVVVDGTSGFGNGRVIPAGPLREDIGRSLARAHAVVIVGEDKAGVADTVRKHGDTPLFYAQLRPDAENPDLFGKPVFAFAGIGRPEKFKDSLIAAGAMLEGWGSYPDHFAYVEEDLRELIAAADAKNAIIVTTAKDHVRLPPALKARVQKFTVHLHWQDPAAVLSFIRMQLGKNWT